MHEKNRAPFHCLAYDAAQQSGRFAQVHDLGAGRGDGDEIARLGVVDLGHGDPVELAIVADDFVRCHGLWCWR